MRVLLSCEYRAQTLGQLKVLDSAGLETREEKDVQKEALKMCVELHCEYLAV